MDMSAKGVGGGRQIIHPKFDFRFSDFWIWVEVGILSSLIFFGHLNVELEVLLL